MRSRTETSFGRAVPEPDGASRQVLRQRTFPARSYVLSRKCLSGGFVQLGTHFSTTEAALPRRTPVRPHAGVRRLCDLGHLQPLKKGSNLSFAGRTMKIIRPGVFLTLLALLVLTGSAISEPATISWPEAVAQLAGERAKAETCVALIKKYGNDAQIARAQLTYTNAKADSDAVIAGLITALSTGQAPVTLASLQTKLSSGVSGLVDFCGTVSNLIRNTARQTTLITDIAQVTIGPLLKMLSDGVSALYNI